MLLKIHKIYAFQILIRTGYREYNSSSYWNSDSYKIHIFAVWASMCYPLTKTDFSWSILRMETTILQTWNFRVYSVLKILDWVWISKSCIPTIPDSTFIQVFKIQKEWKQSEETVGLSTSRRHYNPQILVVIPRVTCWLLSHVFHCQL